MKMALPQSRSSLSLNPPQSKPLLTPPIRFTGEGQDRFTLEQPRKDILIIINPKAGGGVSGQSVAEALRQALHRHYPEILPQVRFFVPQDVQSLVNEIIQHKDTLDRVIAAGGDGTITRVIESILSYPEIKVGILPLGTGNRLAHNLGIPLNLKGALDTALNGKTEKLDVGRFNGVPFTLMAGAGVDAQIIAETNKLAVLKKILGKWSYFLVGWRPLLLGPVVDFDIEVDGKPISVKGIGFVVANAGQVLGNLTLTPGASHNDGMLNMAVLAIQNHLDYLKVLVQLLGSKPATPPAQQGIVHLQGNHFKIRIHPPLPAQVDGDNIEPDEHGVGKSLSDIEITLDRQVNILVPRQHNPLRRFHL